MYSGSFRTSLNECCRGMGEVFLSIKQRGNNCEDRIYRRDIVLVFCGCLFVCLFVCLGSEGWRE